MANEKVDTSIKTGLFLRAIYGALTVTPWTNDSSRVNMNIDCLVPVKSQSGVPVDTLFSVSVPANMQQKVRDLVANLSHADCVVLLMEVNPRVVTSGRNPWIAYNLTAIRNDS